MRMKCRVQQLENGAGRIMCGPDAQSLCQVSGSGEDHVALCDYPVAGGKVRQANVQGSPNSCREQHRLLPRTSGSSCDVKKKPSVDRTAHRGEVSCL
jgi:hypothetical protein